MSKRREVFLALYDGMPKQSPGSEASTARALELVPNLPEKPAILDLGAGYGRQTLALARLTAGRVTAVDLMPEFLSELRRRAANEVLEDRIETIEASMDKLELDAGSFDLVWSEGAAYNIGFDRALAHWRPLLREHGSLVLSEVAWLTRERPERARRMWEREYPGMRSTEENREAIERAGFRFLGDFAQPESDWWEGFYTELEPRIERLRARYTGNGEATAILDESAEEIDAFRNSRGSYGYVFYVATLAG